MFPDGATAIQSKNGNILRRLQVQMINDDIAVFKSIDGGNTFPDVKLLLTNADITFANVQNVDIFYDPGADMCYLKYRIRDNLNYQLGFGRSGILFDYWDGSVWTNIWRK